MLNIAKNNHFIFKNQIYLFLNNFPHKLLTKCSTLELNNKQKSIENHTKLNEKLRVQENFQLLSKLLNVFIGDLRRDKWISNDLSQLEKIIIANKSNQHLENVYQKLYQTNDFKEMVKYFTNNINQLDTKEQSVLFRLFVLINSTRLNAESNKLINELELKFYDQLEKCDLNDFLNYERGFHLLRSKTLKSNKNENIYFFSKSANYVDKLINRSINFLFVREEILNGNDTKDNYIHSLFSTKNSIETNFGKLNGLFSSINRFSIFFSYCTLNRYFSRIIENKNNFNFLFESSKSDLSYLIVSYFRHRVHISDKYKIEYKIFELFEQKFKDLTITDLNIFNQNSLIAELHEFDKLTKHSYIENNLINFIKNNLENINSSSDLCKLFKLIANFNKARKYENLQRVYFNFNQVLLNDILKLSQNKDNFLLAESFRIFKELNKSFYYPLNNKDQILLRLIQFFNDVPFKNYKLNETNVDYSYLYFKHMENKFDKRLANQLIEKYQNTYFADYDLISYNYLMMNYDFLIYKKDKINQILTKYLRISKIVDLRLFWIDLTKQFDNVQIKNIFLPCLNTCYSRLVNQLKLSNVERTNCVVKYDSIQNKLEFDSILFENLISKKQRISATSKYFSTINQLKPSLRLDDENKLDLSNYRLYLENLEKIVDYVNSCQKNDINKDECKHLNFFIENCLEKFQVLFINISGIMSFSVYYNQSLIKDFLYCFNNFLNIILKLNTNENSNNFDFKSVLNKFLLTTNSLRNAILLKNDEINLNLEILKKNIHLINKIYDIQYKDINKIHFLYNFLIILKIDLGDNYVKESKQDKTGFLLFAYNRIKHHRLIEQLKSGQPTSFSGLDSFYKTYTGENYTIIL